ncbi:MAG TPA: hypothetical protein DC000_07490 [Clostridiales bacterium]|nr:hypothetical protein [Clostridiales bacterium]
MDKKIIENQLIAIYQKYIKDNNEVLTLEEKMKDMNINSVDYIKIIIDIENQFDIEFEDEALMPGNFETILDMVNYISKLTNNN